jgi:phosphate transport system substrate-binding protein
MRQLIRPGVVITALMMGLICGVPWALGEGAGPVKISGSRYMFYNVTDFARLFLDRFPTAASIIVSSEDANTGFRRLLNRDIDVFMSFRKIDEDERLDAQDSGIRLTEQIVGHGAVAIVTDPENSVTELTIEQVRKLFAGEYFNWSQVGGPKMPVVPMTRDESVSGTELFFREAVLQGFPVVQHTLRRSDHDIVMAVRKEKGSIADARFTEALRGQKKGLVKIIAIKEKDDASAIIPTEETVKNGTYPISGPLYVYYDAGIAGERIKSFAEFCSVHGLGTRLSAVKE